MGKLTLNDIAGGYQTVDAYNANNALTEAAMENTFSLDGTTPNQMGADIDVNSFDIQNVGALGVTALTASSLVLNGQAVSLTATLTGGLDATEVTYDPTGAGAATTLQAALDDDYQRIDALGGITTPVIVESVTGPQLSVGYDTTHGLEIDVDASGNAIVDLNAVANATLTLPAGTRLVLADIMLINDQIEQTYGDDAAAHYGVKYSESQGNWLVLNAGTDSLGIKHQYNGTTRLEMLVGGGLNFANTLSNTGASVFDRYEEGTFTPELLDGIQTEFTSTATYSQQVGYYTLIGDRVFFELELTATDLGNLAGGSTCRIFTGLDDVIANHDTALSVGSAANLAITIQDTVGAVMASGSQVLLNKWTATTGTTAFTIGNFSADGQISVSGSYTRNRT